MTSFNSWNARRNRRHPNDVTSLRRRRRIRNNILLVLAITTCCIGGMTTFSLWSNIQRNNTKLPFEKEVTTTKNNGTASATNNQAKAATATAVHRHHRVVHFIDQRQLPINDMFSDSWLQPRHLFMKMNVDSIKIVEDGCFRAFSPHNMDKVRMAYDWMDLAVEHMSKWWGVLNILDDNDGDIPFRTAMTAFRTYCRNAATATSSPYNHYESNNNNNSSSSIIPSPLQETIAIVAFQQYTDRRRPERARTLTVSSLAATLASLFKVGFGRVVVVGYGDNNNNDKDVVQESFRYLRDTIEMTTTSGDDGGGDDSNGGRKNEVMTVPPATEIVTKIGSMEVGFVQAKAEEVKSEFVEINMPKGAIDILQKAFRGELDANRMRDVLGSTTDSSHWKYVYLTEPDTILQTRSWVLPQLKEALDWGLILSPHRLQPMPHESDVMGMKDKSRFLPASGNFSKVLTLDTEFSSCCDEHAKGYKPWKDYFDKCGTFWWKCGFERRNFNHSHISPYSLIRLRQGTGIVSIAGTEHGRRCFPKLNGGCDPPGENLPST